MRGKRSCLARNSLHHAAIAAQRVHVEIVDIRESRLIISCCEPPAGERHPDTVREALAERPRRGFHSRRQVRFGMAGTQAAKLAESFDFIERNGRYIENFAIFSSALDSGEMQH